MANNRLWAVCKDDNEAVVLKKCYSDSDWGGEYNEKDAFFIKHSSCPSNRGCGESMRFITEIDDNVIFYDLRDFDNVRIYLKGDEEKPAPKEYLANSNTY